MKQVYWNSKQLAFLRARQHIKVFVGGRGTGKTTTMAGVLREKISSMAGSSQFVSSTTYNQLLTKTMVQVENKWADLGFINGIHYVFGHRPPVNFKKPITPVKKHEYVYTFFNGTQIELLSLEKPDKARGGSYQGGEIDEGLLIKQEHFSKVLYLSLRGERVKFKDHPLYRNINIYTSIPWKSSGLWILDYEKQAKVNPNEVYYQESTSWDNIHVLGEETLKSWERNLPYLEYQVEVMNRRITKAEHAFYHKLDDEKHIILGNFIYDHNGDRMYVKGRNDINSLELIDISIDFSGWFNCLTAYQKEKNVEKLFDFMYVKGDDVSLKNLIYKFSDKYSTHSNKFVRVWGEPRGHDRQADGPTLYERVTEYFRDKGWQCQICVKPGRTHTHIMRSEFMNEILSESNPRLPAFRCVEDTTKDVYIAMKTTEMKSDGIKNKDNEKDRNFPQERATHGPDTVDYYFMQKYYDKIYGNALSIPGTVIFG